MKSRRAAGEHIGGDECSRRSQSVFGGHFLGLAFPLQVFEFAVAAPIFTVTSCCTRTPQGAIGARGLGIRCEPRWRWNDKCGPHHTGIGGSHPMESMAQIGRNTHDADLLGEAYDVTLA
jgi:hypothetical protein